MVYVIQVCWQLASRFRTSWTCSQAVSKPVWHIPLLCVQWKTPGDGQRNCPKHVEFYSKNKLEKLAHLSGFVIRIYHDARSPERQTKESEPQANLYGNSEAWKTWKCLFSRCFYASERTKLLRDFRLLPQCCILTVNYPTFRDNLSVPPSGNKQCNNFLDFFKDAK